MKAKVFEVVLHKLPSGKSPASALEEQLNDFLRPRPDLRFVATHMSTLVAPAEPNAMKQKRQRFAVDLLEAERLDRIRNPSKYLGKG